MSLSKHQRRILLQRFLQSHHLASQDAERAIDRCDEIVSAKLLDRHTAVKNLCNNEGKRFWPTFSELLIADRLLRAGFEVQHFEPGPDFFMLINDKRVWVEVITPEPVNVPDTWTKLTLNEATYLPNDAILLRWLSAIKTKMDQLLGRADREKKGYLQKEIVRYDDIYVIAVNGVHMRSASFSELNGTSNRPFALQATYAIGPYVININQDTGEIIGSEYSFRPTLERENKNSIPCDLFLDPSSKHVSAIWAVDLDIRSLLDGWNPMIIVHNIHAVNPLPSLTLPSQHEFWASKSSDIIAIRRDPGRDF